MQINQYHGSYNRSKRNTGIKYIVIHYTGATGSALNNCKYFAGGNRSASADYFVDDNGIWEYNDPSSGYYTWAVGDGRGRYGITNSNSISIEVVNNGGAFSPAEISHLKELVPYLMSKYGVPASRVCRHYDASRKRCPAHYVDDARWNELRSEITGCVVSSVTVNPSPSAAPSAPVQTHSGGNSSIKEVQAWVGSAQDGIYGKNTKAALVRKLQGELNAQCGARLSVDGIFGAKTYAACINVRKGARGNITKVLQGALICHGYSTNGFDGIFGGGTESAVRSFQRARGLSVDGVAGKNTFRGLLG